MYSPLCDICKNRNMIIQILGRRNQFRCSERTAGCPGFEKQHRYHLNFEEAIMAMLKDRKICECENGEQWRFNHEFSLFEIFYKGSWGASAIELESQVRMWRVVE